MPPLRGQDLSSLPKTIIAIGREDPVRDEVRAFAARLGVWRGDPVALVSPNCAELIPATLAGQLAGIATPLGGGLPRAHLAELLRRSGARVLVTAGPELAPQVWATVIDLADGVDAILVLRPTAAVGAPEPLPKIDGVRVG